MGSGLIKRKNSKIVGLTRDVERLQRAVVELQHLHVGLQRVVGELKAAFDEHKRH